MRLSEKESVSRAWGLCHDALVVALSRRYKGRAESGREEDMESPDTRGAEVIKALGSESMFILDGYRGLVPSPALHTALNRCVRRRS